MEKLVHCFQSRAISYDDYLDKNFDGISNKTSPLAQTYMAATSTNETYTLKEMLQDLDKELFMKVMHVKVHSLFYEKIRKKFPRKQMLDHDNVEHRAGRDIKRYQIMMV